MAAAVARSPAPWSQQQPAAVAAPQTSLPTGSQLNPSACVAGVAEKFATFLREFSPPGYEPPATPAPSADGGATPAPARPPASFIARTVAEMASENETVLYVDYRHLAEFDYDLADKVLQHYERAEPLLREALKEYVREQHPEFVRDAHGPEKEFFVGLTHLHAVERLRDLRTEHIGKLAAFAGTVTRTSDVRPELFLGAFKCMQCGGVVRNVEQFYKFTEPVVCPERTCNNKKEWQLLRDDSIFVDWQRLKVQENVEEIPGGALPRTIDVVVRANNVDRAKPGDKVTFTGALVVCPDVAALTGAKVKLQQTTNDSAGEGVTGLRELGAREMSYKLMFLACSAVSSSEREGVVNIRPDEDEPPERVLAGYSEAQELELRDMVARGPALFDDLARSIAPAVYGCEQVKKAVLLMLMGGVHKVTKEGINLRGDINVAIIGDPSCAKSQLLKYVSGFLPRAVYTSGKASTAAGLTASVVKEPETGEFAIEAGALMLADNGVCCIDEFDKMDVGDQVAIHEAMEQQTISIAKAGIQATLNARASVLAAANPLHGRYDRAKTLRANINLPPAILSRFDLLHVLLDELTEEDDERIARHIVALHRDPAATIAGAPFTMEQLQRFIKYARAIKPRLTPEAQTALVRAFKRLRGDDAAPGSHSAYRITVRQLEALVRLSEATARVFCSPTVEAGHVAEAAKLLKASILKVDVSDLVMDEDELRDEMLQAQQQQQLLQAQQQGQEQGEGAQQQQQQQVVDPDLEGLLEAHPELQRPTQPAQPAAEASPPGSQGGRRRGGRRASSQQDGGAAPATPPGEQQQQAEQPQQPQQQPPQPRQQTAISAERYEFIKNMLLMRLREAQQQAERDAAAAEAAAAADGMQVDGEQQQQPQQQQPQRRAGVVQRELVDWYMEKQLQRGAIADFAAAEAEYELCFKVIAHLIRREGLLVVTGAPKRRADEADDAFRNRLLKERRLALSPNFVPEF